MRSVSAEDEWMEGDVPDSPVKATWSEAEALTDVLEEQVALDFALKRDLLWKVSGRTGTNDRCEYAPSMLGATSTPTHRYPSSSRISPDRPDPQPISRRNAGSPSGRLRSSRAR